MEREIRFRTWDKHNKFFTPVDWVSGHGDNNPRFIVNQYTGLKDKNGEDVFEGDILKCKMGDDPELVLEVQWYSYGWHVSGELTLMPLFPYNEYGEVIGNIYAGVKSVNVWLPAKNSKK